jgi:hypothetical protein
MYPQPRRHGHDLRHARRHWTSSRGRRVLRLLLGPVLAVVVVTIVVGHLPGIPLKSPQQDRSSDLARPEPVRVVGRTSAPSRVTATAHGPPASKRREPTSRWPAVLGRLDDERARAWSRGDLRLLRPVYTPASPALRLDGQALASYAKRGLRVRDVHLHFTRIAVLERGSRVVRLRTVDRLHPMTAVSSHGVRLRLPRDRATRHLVVLRRAGGRWRIAAVRAV